MEAAGQRTGSARAADPDQEAASTGMEAAKHVVVWYMDEVTATHVNRLQCRWWKGPKIITCE